MSKDEVIFAMKSSKDEDTQRINEYFKVGPQSVDVVTNHLLIKSRQEKPMLAIENDQLTLQLESLKMNSKKVFFPRAQAALSKY